MCMAIECSVTVSMGEDITGVLREIFLVIGVSRATSEAAKPGIEIRHSYPERSSLIAYQYSQEE